MSVEMFERLLLQSQDDDVCSKILPWWDDRLSLYPPKEDAEDGQQKVIPQSRLHPSLQTIPRLSACRLLTCTRSSRNKPLIAEPRKQTPTTYHQPQDSQLNSCARPCAPPDSQRPYERPNSSRKNAIEIQEVLSYKLATTPYLPSPLSRDLIHATIL
jgi:hypothetical protein